MKKTNFSRRKFLACASSIMIQSCSKHNSGLFYVPPKDTHSLILYDVADPPTLDPARSWGWLDGRLIGLVFSNLVRFDRSAKIQPDLAYRWTISEDGLIYTFHLRPDAKFSHGRPIVAKDVKYSLQRVLDPQMASPSRWVVERIKEIEILDPHKIALRLEKPFAPFVGMLAMPATSIVPEEEITRLAKEGAPFGEHPVGGGPWLFKEWKHDQSIAFERNEDYWGQKPKLRRLLIKIISNPFTAIAEFETGNLMAINPLPVVEIPRWTHHPQWKAFTKRSPVLNTDMLIFNCQKTPFDQKRVRQSLCELVDTKLLLQCVREGAGFPSYGLIPPGLEGSSTQKPSRNLNKTSIQTILQSCPLAERGIDLVLPSRENFTRTTGEVVQAIWKKAGIPVRLRRLEWTTYRKVLREGQFDAAYRGWFADYPDGDNFVFPLFHSSQIGSGNMSRFHDPEIDRLIEASQSELDPLHRKSLLERVNQALFEASPALFLWHEAKYIVTQPWLYDYSEPLIFNGIRYRREYIERPV